MKTTELINVVAYRMHTPKWASQPLSGEGAALHGGRLNRTGTPTLYLALDTDTAIREYQQLSPLMPPGTLVAYAVNAAPIVDFRSGYDAAEWHPLWEDFYCDWRELWFNHRIEPPTWVLGDEVLAGGFKGVLFSSSIVPDGYNLALYTDSLELGDIAVHDPARTLPRNQDSWR